MAERLPVSMAVHCRTLNVPCRLVQQHGAATAHPCPLIHRHPPHSGRRMVSTPLWVKFRAGHTIMEGRFL